MSLIAEVRKAHAQLQDYAKASQTDLLASTEKMNSLKYLFVVGIEVCIDICQHLSARRFQEIPDSYSRCFDIQVKRGFISEGLGTRLSRLARFRNVLVHLYWKVDDHRVLENLSEIGALNEFSRTVVAALNLKPG